jgi:hypothetical protein
MLDQLKRPFKKRYDKVREYATQYVGPVKDSASKLMAMLPKMDAFAGSEDQAEGEAPGAGSAKSLSVKGFIEKFKEFKHSLKGLNDFQKLLLLTIAVVLPAGMFISVALLGFFTRKK